ncbi:MAG: phosphatidylserine decarboxylase [Bacteroidetes bacterium]|nr:phosphatidylserine decarboxylase [Bacteroidota bacterium]
MKTLSITFGRFARKIAAPAIILFCGFCQTAPAQQADCPPVIKLRSMYSGDVKFRGLIDSMFLNVQPLPDGSQNYWKGKNINDLYIFLNRWFYTLPTASNSLDDITRFSLLYYHNPYGLRFVNQEPGLSWTFYFVKEQGRFMDSRQSTGNIHHWLADSSLHNEEYTVPANGYQSFNQFFTRKLKPGTRPVARPDDDAVIVSPVDGMISQMNVDLKPGDALPIKGRMRLNLNQLLGNSKFTDHFIDGTALSVILLPRNYHHYHSPVSGELVESREDVGNVLFGSQLMDFFMTDNGDFSVFENYKHGYFIFHTNRYGYVAMIPVGLETIGSVVFEDRVKNISSEKPMTITKGERLGHFAYGGSLVILLFEKGRFSSINVQQGQQIGIFNQEVK